MKNLIHQLVAIVGLTLLASGAMAQEPDAKILRLTNPAQSIGVHIGDVLSRKIEIEVKSPYQLSRNAFPMKGSSRNGIELEDLQVESSPGKLGTRYTIDLRYQVFADASTPVVMQLPPETFALTGGPQALLINVPAWRFWFSPLVTGNIGTAKASLQPQYKATLIDPGAHLHRLAASLGLFIIGLVGLVYVNADRRWLPFMNGAFAQAHRNLKKLPKNQEGAPKALLYLHQAFNKVYGANLFARDIEKFLGAHPEFAKAKADIESFYERSGRALFAGQNHDGEALINDLISFSKSLRDCERGVS